MTWWTRFKMWWTRPGPRRWRGVALVAPFVVIVAVAVGYTNHVQRQGDERWCELIVILDDQYQSIPPDSQVAANFAEALHRLREQLRC